LGLKIHYCTIQKSFPGVDEILQGVQKIFSSVSDRSFLVLWTFDIVDISEAKTWCHLRWAGTHSHVYTLDWSGTEGKSSISHIAQNSRRYPFFKLKYLPNTEIFREIDSVYGEGVINHRSVQNWTHRFADGDSNLKNNPMSDRPRSTENVAKIRELLADDPYLLQKRIALILNIHQATVKHILREDLSFRKIKFKRIPHHLDDNQKRERVRLSRKLLEFLESKSEPSLRTYIQRTKCRFAMTICDPPYERI
jgi:hypothetical protein